MSKSDISERWVRPHITADHLTDKQRDDVFVLGRFQAILNKLTPTRFQKLAEQALALNIDTREKLQGCVDLIFKRTSRYKEQRFCIAYANLCKVLSPLAVEFDNNGQKEKTNFRRVLLTKFQTEFLRGFNEDKAMTELTKSVEAAASQDERRRLQAKLNECVMLARHSALGTVVFIAEMFKLSMISETVCHEMLVNFLKCKSDNLRLEGCSLFLTVVGKHLDQPKAEQRMDGYFTRIDDIIKFGKISIRVKFMLQDLVELRANDWLPRYNVDGPLTTIEQIRSEARQSEQGPGRNRAAERVRKDKLPPYYRR